MAGSTAMGCWGWLWDNALFEMDTMAKLNNIMPDEFPDAPETEWKIDWRRSLSDLFMVNGQDKRLNNKIKTI